MLTINLEWDADALAAPQSFRDGVEAAASVLQAAISDPITVNIDVGYGEFDLGGPEYTPLASDYSLGGVNENILVSYSALRAALAANESSPVDAEAVNALPSSVSLDGQSYFYISSAQAKAFGVLPANDPVVDGFAGFPTSFTGAGLTGTAIAEELHAMGLLNYVGDLGLFSYTSPGNHFLPDGTTSTTPAYFSIDGGYTDLADYNVTNDETLFLDPANDALDFPNQGTTLSQLDLEEINAIGFDVSSTPVLATPNDVPTVVAGTASVQVQDVSLDEATTISAASFLASISVPAGDAIISYAFLDTGSGNGHFSLDGVVEPDGQYIYILDTQLDELVYQAGASPGSETIFVAGFDYDADAFTGTASLTATTVAPPVYSIAASSASQPDSANGTTFTFTVSRTGDASQAALLSYTVSGSGADPAPESLFESPAGSVSFAAGATSVTLQVAVVGATISSAEAFTVTLAGPTGTEISNPAATNTILATPGADFQNASSPTTITSALPQAQTFEAYAHYDLYLAAPSSITNIGTNLSSVSLDDQGDVAVYTTAGAGSDGHVVRVSGTGQSIVSSGDGDDSVVASNGDDLIATGAGANTVYLVSGDNTLASEGNDTVDAGSGSDTISISGDSVINPGVANLNVFLSPSASLELHTGTGSVAVNGGFGSGSFSGGTDGDNLLIAGTGPTTLYAGGNGDTLVASGGSSTTLNGWSGEETMIGQFSQGTDTFNFGAASVFASGGSGTNIFNIGSGSNAIVGLQGTDTFDFTNGAGGGTTYISDFNLASDRVHLSGYAPNQAAVTLGTATYYQGSEILSLDDGTRITFGHVTGITPSNFV